MSSVKSGFDSYLFTIANNNEPNEILDKKVFLFSSDITYAKMQANLFDWVRERLSFKDDNGYVISKLLCSISQIDLIPSETLKDEYIIDTKTITVFRYIDHNWDNPFGENEDLTKWERYDVQNPTFVKCSDDEYCNMFKYHGFDIYKEEYNYDICGYGINYYTFEQVK